MKDETQNKMTLKEQYEESLFAVLMDEFAEVEGRRLIEENERLNNDLGSKLPCGLEARCEKTISNVIRTNKRRETGRKVSRALGKVAIFVLVCGITFAVLFNTVSAFRITVWKILKQEDALNTNISINEAGEQSSEMSIKIPPGSYLPTWVPNGYELMSYNNTEKIVSAVFSNSKDNLIYYFEFGNSQVLGVNTNSSYNVENIEINGFEGLLVSRDNEISVTWVDDDRGLLVRIRATDIDKETVIRIAESVKKN